MIRAIGIDISTTTVGYAVIDQSDAETLSLVRAGTCNARDNVPLIGRLAELYGDIYNVVCAAVKEVGDEDDIIVGIEKPFVHPRGNAGVIELGAGFGVAAAAVERALCPTPGGRTTLHASRIETVAPASVKLAVAGHGHSTKEQVRSAVMRFLNLDSPPEPLDVSDAIAIALTALFRAGTTRTAGPAKRVRPNKGERP